MNLIRTVSALLYYQDPRTLDIEVLLHKHPKFDMYMGFGGKVFPNETENWALSREVYEETGILIKNAISAIDYQRFEQRVPDHVTHIYCDNGDDILVDHVYCVKVDEKIRQQSLKVEEQVFNYGWFNYSSFVKLKEQMFDDTKQQVEKIFRPFLETEDEEELVDKWPTPINKKLYDHCGDFSCEICREIERLTLYDDNSTNS